MKGEYILIKKFTVYLLMFFQLLTVQLASNCGTPGKVHSLLKQIQCPQWCSSNQVSNLPVLVTSQLVNDSFALPQYVNHGHGQVSSSLNIPLCLAAVSRDSQQVKAAAGGTIQFYDLMQANHLIGIPGKVAPSSLPQPHIEATKLLKC